ncbi:MAG TPA: response regulator [Spirochaetota bacterium]|nr:response regulator [Spirochaetota bacterium]
MLIQYLHIVENFFNIYFPEIVAITVAIALSALTLAILYKTFIKTRELLKISNSKFKLIFQHSPLGIIYFDDKGIILECNSEFVKIIGSSREKLIGLDMKKLPNAKLQSTLADTFSGKIGLYDGLYRSFTGNKETIIRGIFTPIFLNKKMYGGIAIIEDVTLQKLHEQELKDAKAKAERESMAKTIFLENMSHEVRTPLNGISGILQLLEKISTNEQQIELIDLALSSVNRLTRLLGNILDLTKIETDNIYLISEEFSIRKTIYAIVKTLESECEKKSIKIDYAISEEVPETLIGDELRIRQILENLAWNSYKFTNEGSISIEVRFNRQSHEKGKLILTVKDTGIGIEPEQLDEITQPFYQQERSYTKKFQGAGLGLTIVKRLIHLMEGSLNISSRPGYGTEITCTMIVGCIDNTKKSTLQAKGESGKPLKILIADDDRINSLMLKKLIEKMNHCVDSVSDGLAALEKVKQRDYDVVFMDIQMPVMNGIEALENIKNLPDSKNRPKVVAVTAYAMPGDQEKFLQAGFDDYISKPIDMELIEEALDRLF